ncbi:proline-specific permease [Aspergillus sclerotiicarbonarius CBS 121057]|uniref:Proline-specific permease n=1 Tax=Aspergillus sclerotiicarbonarius (strain CBS 121057 / IBT 28362) TaxID=1448318 RepID=A0A319DXR5_ASPSB|nr:proline-specific permease [Aspergillus sclerotiicarbonarius CBS 121057]
MLDAESFPSYYTPSPKTDMIKADPASDVGNGMCLEMGQVEDFIPVETARGLKSRHTQMIAIGGAIGTGLFIGSGEALSIGGPLFLLLGYSLLTALVFCIVTATTEFGSFLPVRGSSVAYFGHRFVSNSMGFALGWMYYYVFAITVPSEITAAALVIDYWPNPVNIGVWITIMLIVIVGLNCFPVKVYGETEFWFASIKVIGILGMFIMALVITCGGAPDHKVIGFAYWNNPGAVNEYIVGGASGRLVAFIATLRFSVYIFAFTPELLIITAGEMQSPRRNLPTAGRRFFIRLVIFYIIGAFLIGLICPSNNSQLLGSSSSDASASPWAIAAKDAGIKGLDSVINIVILLSAWSAGNSWLYLASRTLYSMADFGTAPQIFKRCTPSGVPYVSLGFTSLFSLLAYMNVSSSASTVFNWFVKLVNSGGYLSWVCVCIIYIRFRKATFAQELNVADLPYRSRFQPYAAYVAGSLLCLLLLLNGFTVFFPGHWDISTFITSYIGIPIFVFFFLGHKLFTERHTPWFIPSNEVDLTTGLPEILAAEVPASGSAGRWYKKLTLIFG